MKIYNKSNSILIINNVSVGPKSFAIFEDDIKNNPDFINFLEKKYIEIVTSKKEKKFKTEESPKINYVVNDKKVKEDQNVKYIVSDNEYKISDESVIRNVEGESDIIEKDSIPSDEITEEVLASEIDKYDDLKIIDADEEILKHSEETAKIVVKNGKFGAKEISVQKAVKENLEKVSEEIKENITPQEILGSNKFKKFSELSEYKQRIEINKSTDKDFLSEVASLSKNSSIKKLAQQRLKEL